MHYSYNVEGVCSHNVSFDIVDGKLRNIVFLGGCDGNLRAIGRLAEGADAREVAEILRGNRCGDNDTSCADQLSRAISKALAGAAK